MRDAKEKRERDNHTEQNRYYTIANYHEKITIQLEKWFINKLIYNDANETHPSHLKKEKLPKTSPTTTITTTTKRINDIFLRNGPCIRQMNRLNGQIFSSLFCFFIGLPASNYSVIYLYSTVFTLANRR